VFKNVDWNTIYSFVFTTGGILAGLGYVARLQIKKHTEELKDDLAKIMYALYNDGKTGLINKVDQLIENQQVIKIDVEVLKAKADNER
jgi:hypothetical protein